MARGTGLTLSEKYAIRSMMEDGLSQGKMAEVLGRSATAVRNFIQKELKNTEQFINSEKDLMPPEVVDAAIAKLVEAGYSEFDAQSSVNRLKKKITKPITMEELDTIVRWADTHKSPRDSFVTQADGGRKGVAVMTAGASEILDGLKADRAPKDVPYIFKQEDARR